MIKISVLKAYFDSMANRIQATKSILVRNETELAQKIKQVTAGELFLVVVIPSSDTRERDKDNILEEETLILYTVMKVDRANQIDADIVTGMELTQDCITALKSQLYADATNSNATYHRFIERIDFNRMHTDPEYNYLGCDGYSLSFILTSTGF